MSRLVKCPDCGGKVSAKALDCPHCGCPMDEDEDVEVTSSSRGKKKGGTGCISGCLMILVVSVAATIALAWWLDRVKQGRQAREARQAQGR